MRQPYTLNLKANRRGLTPTQEIKQRSTQKKNAFRLTTEIENVRLRFGELTLNPIQHGCDDDVLFGLVVRLMIEPIPAFVGHLAA